MNFKAKIRKASNVWVVTIPATYIRNGLLKEDQEYDFEAKEVKE